MTLQNYKEQSYILALILTEPTKPPRTVRIHWIKETSAKLSWNAIPCSHQNGRMLWYLVRHDYELPNGTFAVQQSITSWNDLNITLVTLRPNRKYVVRVAGVNGAGVGAFSSPIELITPGGIYQQTHTSLLKCMSSQFCFSPVTQFVQAECKSHPLRQPATI